MGAACCKECCGAIYEDELEALTDQVFNRFRGEHGNIPAAKVQEAARAVLKLYGGGLLPYIKTSQLHLQHYRVPGAPGAPLNRYQFGVYIHLLAKGAEKAYVSCGDQALWFNSGGLAHVGGYDGGGCGDGGCGGGDGGGGGGGGD